MSKNVGQRGIDEAATIDDPSKSINSAIDAEKRNGIDRNAAHYFALTGAAWLAILSLPLLAFPRLLALIVGDSPTEPVGEGQTTSGGVIRQLNSLEIHLSALLGLAFLSLGLLLVVQTGALPLTSNLHSATESSSPSAADAPFRTPTVVIASVFFGGCGYLSWQASLKTFGVINAAIGFWGFWVLLFANEKHLTKSGKDNSMSSFPFKNKVAHSRKVD